MPTINQLLRYGRQAKRKIKITALTNRPQRKAVCVSIKIMKPRKPNSASRKVARVRFTDGYTTYAYIPGEGHDLQEHGMVLIKGRGVHDLPGVKYTLVRGVYNLGGVINRKTSRSRYATRKT